MRHVVVIVLGFVFIGPSHVLGQENSQAGFPPAALPAAAVQRLGSTALRSPNVEGLDFSSDAKRLAVASDFRIQLFDATTGELQREIRLADHTDQTQKLVFFCDDDRVLLFKDLPHGVRFWNLEKNEYEARPVRDIIRRTKEFLVACSADGRRLLLKRALERPPLKFDPRAPRPAVRARPNIVHIVRDAVDGKLIFEEETADTFEAWLSPSGKRLALVDGAIDKSQQVQLRDVDTGEKLPELGPIARGASEILFAPDDRTVYIADRYGEVEAWDSETQRSLRKLHAPDNVPTLKNMSLSRDGKRLAVNLFDGPVTVVDPATGKVIRRISRTPTLPARAMTLSPDGELMAVGGEQSFIEIWNVATGKETIRSVGHRQYIYAVAAAPDGQSIAMIDKGRMLLWNRAGEVIKTGNTSGYEFGAMHDIQLSYTADGRSIVSMMGNGKIAFRDSTTLLPQFFVQRTQPHPVLTVLSPGLEACAFVVAGNAVRIQPGPNYVTRPKAVRYEARRGPERPIERLEFCDDGHWLAGNSADGEVTIWPTFGGRSYTWQSDGQAITALALSNDGGHVATAMQDGAVRVRIREGGVVAARKSAIAAPPIPATALDFHPQDSRLAIGYGDGSVRLWNLQADETETILTAAEETKVGVARLAWSPDGARLGIGFSNGKFQTWPKEPDAETKMPTAAGAVSVIHWLEDGKQAAVGGSRGSMVVCDAKTLKTLRVGSGALSPIVGIGVHPQKKRLRFYTAQGAVHEEPTAPGRWLAAFPQVYELHTTDKIMWSAASPDGRRFAATTETALLTWNDPRGPQTGEYPLTKNWGNRVEFSRTSQQLGVAEPDGLSIRNFEDGEQLIKLDRERTADADEFHFSPTENVVAVRNGRKLGVWNTQSGRPLQTISVPFTREFAFSPDGAMLTSLQNTESDGYELVLFEIVSGKPLHRIDLMAGGWPWHFAMLDGGENAVISYYGGMGIIWTLRPTTAARTEAATPQELENWWRQLAAENPAEAYAAMWSFRDAGKEAIDFLVRRLPTPGGGNETQLVRVRRLLEQLDQPKTEAAATQTLIALRATTEKDLQWQRTNGSLPPAVRTKLEAILQTDPPPPNAAQLQLCRAVQILGHFDDEAARECLKKLARGLPELPQTAAAVRARNFQERRSAAKAQ